MANVPQISTMPAAQRSRLRIGERAVKNMRYSQPSVSASASSNGRTLNSGAKPGALLKKLLAKRAGMPVSIAN